MCIRDRPFIVGGVIMIGTLALVFNYLRTSYTPLHTPSALAD